MITKLIQKIKQVLRKPIQVLIEPKNPSPHKTVPAPVVTPSDSWFGEAPRSKKQLRHLENAGRTAEKPPTKEVDDIHQVMYNKATAKGNTTVQLDPQPQGGSENVWQSGAGPHF